MNTTALERALLRAQEAKVLLEEVIQTPLGLDPEVEGKVGDAYAKLNLLEETIQTLIDGSPGGVPQTSDQLPPFNQRRRDWLEGRVPGQWREEPSEETEPLDGLEEMARRGATHLTQIKSMGGIRR